MRTRADLDAALARVIADANGLANPRVLTPGTTVAELLYLFAEQPEPRRCYAVVRVGRDGYDVLALDDLREALEPLGEAALPLALSFANASSIGDRSGEEGGRNHT